MQNAIELSKILISQNTVTPSGDRIINILCEILTKIGFKNTILRFTDKTEPAVTNLLSTIELGSSGPHIGFLGHVDVVPPGDCNLWQHPPFDPTITDNKLYGRGAVDMKTSIACFIEACANIVEKINIGRISIILSGNEEGNPINGTPKIIEHLEKEQLIPDYTIVGEPTSEVTLGDTIKTGRRGSTNILLTARGTQGHVAYSEKCTNPIEKLIYVLNDLQSHQWDLGDSIFPPSKLNITAIHSPDIASNVIPDWAQAKFNIRTSPHTTLENIQNTIAAICKNHNMEYAMEIMSHTPSFHSKNNKLESAIIKAIQHTTKQTPQIKANGGTSDARFMQKVSPVVEFGPLNETAHKINEHIATQDILQLTNIYECFLCNILSQD